MKTIEKLRFAVRRELCVEIWEEWLSAKQRKMLSCGFTVQLLGFFVFFCNKVIKC